MSRKRGETEERVRRVPRQFSWVDHRLARVDLVAFPHPIYRVLELLEGRVPPRPSSTVLRHSATGAHRQRWRGKSRSDAGGITRCHEA